MVPGGGGRLLSVWMGLLYKSWNWRLMASSEMDRMMSCSASEPVVADSKLAMFGRSYELLAIAEVNEYHLSETFIV